jgi:protein gp37
MGKGTAISWATDTFNLWWGCEHASRDDPRGIDADPAATSPECDSCYAETFDHRVGGVHWGPSAEPRWFGDAYWAKLRTWNAEARAAGVRRRVFVSSMADWAQRHRDPVVNAKMDAVRARLWGEVQACPWLDFLLLTKRAERLTELLPWHTAVAPGRMPRDDAQEAVNAPWPNVWVGVTCGVRSSLWRVAKLREIRAAKRFISCEPLLEHIPARDWDRALNPHPTTICDFAAPPSYPIDWLIVGDESGPHRRPAQLDWVRTAREAALRHGVTFHLKQLHVSGKKVHLPILDGRTHPAIPR